MKSKKEIQDRIDSASVEITRANDFIRSSTDSIAIQEVEYDIHILQMEIKLLNWVLDK